MMELTEIQLLLDKQKQDIFDFILNTLTPSKKISRKEAAEFLGYGYDSMRSIPTTDLPCEKVGKLWLYDMKDLQAYKLKKVAMTQY
jgi:hypothetical protein